MGQTGSFRTGRTVAGCAAAALLGGTTSLASAQSIDDLRDLSLGELASVNVSSVSKATESLADAPAAIYVISHDDIVRSGATTVPEILRLAPSLFVAQQTASDYVITARGLSGNKQTQSFPNKLLVLIDGRSVYTPLYSGVYWDMQDIVPDDIARIEVISGPGATLWGANAYSGVVNIITRRSGETQGALLSADGGGRERTAAVRVGLKLSDAISARAYVRGLDEDESRTSARLSANDDWWQIQGGFRLDWALAERDDVTLQGDLLNGRKDQFGATDETFKSRNLLARWTTTASNGSALELQGYYDRSGRRTQEIGSAFTIDTYDAYVQHNSSPSAKNDLVWGGGLRIYRFDNPGNASVFFEPPKRTLLLANVFAQYGYTLGSGAKLILGLKAEKDPYVGVSFLPSARFSWKAADKVLLWAAVSRAVRAPTPFDRDVVEQVGSQRLLVGDSDFRTEKLTTFEAGTRVQAGARVSFSVSTYYNIYNDLRSIELTPVTLFPLTWGNGIRGTAYGTDAWADVSIASWWKLTGGFSLLHQNIRFKSGIRGLGGIAQAGDDPARHATLSSSMNFGPVTVKADFRYVGPLPNPAVPSYCELGGRIGWRLSDRLQLSLSGLNLLHKWHQELPLSTANQVPRKILAGVKWRI